MNKMRENSGGWIGRAQPRSLVMRDGVRIFYEVMGQTESQDVLILANGLGGRLHAWGPLVEYFAPRWRLLTWDYRGIFESDGPQQIRRLAIPEHAEDLLELMEHEGIEKAVLVGWSMGVQVSLEMASLYPERVERLVLLNGTYGKVLQTAFQPLFRVPWLNKFLHELLDYLQRHPKLTGAVGAEISKREEVLRFFGRLYGGLYRQPQIEEMLVRYVNDVFTTNFGNYLRLFQELDSHSVYHLLREIEHPTLIISGLLDVLTPAYQSKEMARKLPDSRHVSFVRGTHFLLQERPGRVMREVAQFVEGGRV